MAEPDALISNYSHEAHRPRADAALVTLRKVASMVKPIMRQRGWRVGTLTEFYPHQQNLLGLNVNRGQKICLRLRYPSDETLFLPIEQVIDTMLHELSHNVFGAHDEKFHRLWNELRDEYEALLRKGYTGEGFLSAGHRLGGSTARPMHEARRLARAAAERRRIQGGMGPRRIGGAAPSNMVDIRKTIADAAQRRRDILKGCGTTEINSAERDRVLEDARRNGVETVAEIDDADMQAIQQAFMDMVKEDEEANSNNYSERSPIILDDPSEEERNHATPSNGTATQTNEGQWTCPICTFLNPATYLCCEMCLIERPSTTAIPEPQPSQSRQASRSDKPLPGDHRVLKSGASAANIARFKAAEEASINMKPIGWTCHNCSTFMESQWWTCSSCGTMKLSS